MIGRKGRRAQMIWRVLALAGAVGATVWVGGPAQAANGIGGRIGTIAGTGTATFTGDGGLATAVGLSAPSDVAVDAAGNVYIADTTNNRLEVVPKVSGTLFGQSMIAGARYTIVGTGTSGSSANGIAGTAALLNAPSWVAIDSAGTVYVDNNGASCIQAISQAAGTVAFGVSMTVADAVYDIVGTCGTTGSSANGTAAHSALLKNPDSFTFDPSGHLFIVDTSNNCIRAVSNTASTSLFNVTMTVANGIYTIVGTCASGNTNASANGTTDLSVRMRGPEVATFDSSGHLFYTDTGNNCVRATSSTAATSLFGTTLTTAHATYTVAGSCSTTTGNAANGAGDTAGASFNLPYGVAVDASNNLYIADATNDCIRATSSTAATSLYGTTLTTKNSLYAIAGVCATAGATVSGSTPTATDLRTPDVATIASGDLYIADGANNQIHLVPAATGVQFSQSMTLDKIYTVAGTGAATFGGNGTGSEYSATNVPHQVAVDSAGNVYIADTTNNRIRMIAASTCSASCAWGLPSTYAGSIYTIVGTGTAGTSADGTVGTAALVSAPQGVTLDAGGDLYIANTGSHCIQAISQTAGTTLYGVTLTAADAIYTIAGTCGTSGAAPANGTGDTSGSQRFSSPESVAFDSAGDLFVDDTGNFCIRAASPTAGATAFGITLTTADAMYKIAGTCGTSGSAPPDGTGNTVGTQRFSTTSQSIAFDGSGHLFIADSGNACIRATSSTAGAVVFGVTLTTANALYRVVGTCGTSGAAPANGTGDTAGTQRLNAPYGIVFDASGDLLIADTTNACVRAASATAATVVLGVTLTTANSLYTVAGTCASAGSTGDGGAATAAKLTTPEGLAIDSGDLYIADAGNNKVREVSGATDAALVTFSTPEVTFPKLTLTGNDATVTTYFALHVAPDPHWSLSISRTVFTNGTPSQDLTSSALNVQSAAWVCDAGSCTAPTNAITYPLTIPVTTPTNFFADSTGAGMGVETFALSLAIPANAYVGTYTSDWTITTQAGP